MKLTILGSGTAAPRLNKNMSGYLLEINNKKFLFDSGPGTIRQLLKLKLNLTDINHIFYTHLHNDHINDLPAIIWSNNYETKRKNQLNIYGPKGFKKYFNILFTKILKPEILNYKIRIKELDNKVEKIKIKNKHLIIITKSVKHTKESIGYRIEYNNKVLTYTGDLGFCNSVIDLAKDSNILIIECSFPNNKKQDNHLTPRECGIIANKANVKKIILTHSYPECDNYDIVKQCKQEFNGKIIKAKDFMKIIL